MIEVTCTAEQLALLGTLSRDGLSFPDYCASGLPVAVARLTEPAWSRLVPDGHVAVGEYKHVVDLTPADRADDVHALALRLTSKVGVEPAATAQMRNAAPLVAEIAALDRRLFGAPTRASVLWVQDRPGPRGARDVRWHQDFRLRPGDGHPWRFYLTRSSCPTEFIRDHFESTVPQADSWFGRCYGLYEDPDREVHSDRDPDAWLAEMQGAGRWWRAEPYEVVLISATWHRSHRPDVEQASTFLHVGFH